MPSGQNLPQTASSSAQERARYWGRSASDLSYCEAHRRHEHIRRKALWSDHKYFGNSDCFLRHSSTARNYGYIRQPIRSAKSEGRERANCRFLSRTSMYLKIGRFLLYSSRQLSSVRRRRNAFAICPSQIRKIKSALIVKPVARPCRCQRFAPMANTISSINLGLSVWHEYLARG